MPSALEGDVSALFVEAVFYGVYLSTLLLCLRPLVYAHDEWKPFQLVNWSLVTLTLVIWMTTSLDLALSFRRSISRILHLQGHSSAPNLSWSDILMCLLVNFHALLADAVMIYRCWIIFSKSKIVLVFPVPFWLTGAICSIVGAYWKAIKNTDSNLLKQIMVSFWTCSITVNLYATCLITYKLMRFAKLTNLQTRRTRFAMRIIVESGMLYTVTAIMVLFSCFWFQNTLQLIITAINFQTVGIAFNLVIIRATSAPGDDGIETTTAAPLSTVRYIMSDVVTSCAPDKTRARLSYADEDTGMDQGEPSSRNAARS